MASLERRIKKDQSVFLSFAKNYTSQGGEDGILEELFLRIGEFHSREKRFCVDIGAWDGKHLSNTYQLLNFCNWGGLLIEAEQARFSDLSKLYEGHQDIICLNHLVDIGGSNSLLNLLEIHNVPLDFDFLCIDVDGADFHLWESIGKKFQAIVVCIEFNPTIPNDIYFVQTRNISVQQGSSLLALFELGKELGYSIIATTMYNAIFLRNDFYQKLNLNIPQDIDILHQATMSTEVFQTYDGELHYVGMKKMLWHKLPLNPQQLQILPKKNRKYPFAPSEQFHLERIKSIYNDILEIVQGENSLSLSDIQTHDYKFNTTSPILELVSSMQPILDSTLFELKNDNVYLRYQKIQYLIQQLFAMGEMPYLQGIVEDYLQKILYHLIFKSEGDNLLRGFTLLFISIQFLFKINVFFEENNELLAVNQLKTLSTILKKVLFFEFPQINCIIQFLELLTNLVNIRLSRSSHNYLVCKCLIDETMNQFENITQSSEISSSLYDNFKILLTKEMKRCEQAILQNSSNI